MGEMQDKQSGALTVRDEAAPGAPTGSKQDIKQIKKSRFSMKIGTKIGIGYAIVAVIFVGAVGTTLWLIGNVNRTTSEIVNIQAPSAEATLTMLNGMNHSLASLRGWINLGKERFIEDREEAWLDKIDFPLEDLKDISTNWTDLNDIERLEDITKRLEDLRGFQQEIEDIAQTSENEPALKILQEQAAPQVDILMSNITKMIDLEGELEATAERKALLGMMADVRGTTGLGIANLRDYVIFGNENAKNEFNRLWDKNARRFGDLKANVSLLTPGQREAFDEFSKAREVFDPLPQKTFAIRESDEWNLAEAWLDTKVAPTAFEIKETLEAILSSQQKLMATNKIEVKKLASFLTLIEWILLGVGIVFSAVIGVFISRSISKAVNSLVSVIKEIAAGDFTKEIKVGSRDEIGILGETVNGMVSELRDIIVKIKGNARTIASSSEELSSVSTQMAGASEEMSTQSRSVAGATEEMSTNVNTMASATEEMSVNVSTLSSNAEQMSQNMNTVASAVEEMSASINDVEKNAKEASKIAGQANEMASGATKTMNTLGDAANEIGKVTEVIKRIAEQTNLLALNATIEAASAGDAGKGFAVVANEIKELANQSAQAAEDIANKIAGVQESTTEAVKSINSVSGIIDTINKSVNVIANSVEEQTRAANDISLNVSQANKGVQSTASSIAEVDKGTNDVARNAGDAAKAANEVASNIQDVDKSVTESSANIQRINTSASDLASISSNLEELVAQFKVEEEEFNA